MTQRDKLIQLYEEQKVTLDRLPYSWQFEYMFINWRESLKDTREEMWRQLLNLRKTGQLPKLKEKREPKCELVMAYLH